MLSAPQALAPSAETATSLAEMYPALQFVVQLIEPAHDYRDGAAVLRDNLGGRISVQRRTPGAAQDVRNADVYLVRLTGSADAEQVRMELMAHLDVLRANEGATLVLALPVLPEAGTCSPVVEARARLGELCRLQLTGQGLALERGELMEAIGSVGDAHGRLEVIRRIGSSARSDSAATVIGVRYQAYLDPETPPCGPG